MNHNTNTARQHAVKFNSKRILRFYYSADRLNCALDNLILNTAFKSGEGAYPCEAYAQKISCLIAAKRSLSLLWGYINGVMQFFDEEDEAVLMSYAFMRQGVSRLGGDERRKMRRVVVRFARKARNIERYSEGVGLVNAYYCLLSSGEADNGSAG